MIRTLYRDDHLRLDDQNWTWPDARITAERECPWPWIVLPRHGVYTKFCTGGSFVANRVSALFYDQGETYRYIHHTRQGACTYLQLEPHILQEAFGHDEVQRNCFDHAVALRDPRLDLEHQTLLAAFRRESEPDPMAAQESLFGFVRHLLIAAVPTHGEAARRRGTRDEHRDLVARTSVALTEQLDETLTLPEIATRVSSSPFHLARVFRARTGISLHAYRTKVRLQIALERLSESRTDTTELALDLGFSSRSHFSTTFKQVFGLPPSEFRKRASVATVAGARAWLRDSS